VENQLFIFPWCRETWAELVHWVGSVVPGFFSSVGREQCPREPSPGPHFRWGWGYEKCSWHNPPRGIHYGGRVGLSRGHFSRGRCSHTPSVAGGAGGLREKCPMHNPSPSCNPPLFHDLGARSVGCGWVSCGHWEHSFLTTCAVRGASLSQPLQGGQMGPVCYLRPVTHYLAIYLKNGMLD
jgi:hypothetical protein